MLEKPLLAQFFDHRRHLVIIKAFTLVAVKGYAELIVGLFVLAERYIDKPAPELNVLLVVVFKLCLLYTSRCV